VIISIIENNCYVIVNIIVILTILDFIRNGNID